MTGSGGGGGSGVSVALATALAGLAEGPVQQPNGRPSTAVGPHRQPAGGRVHVSAQSFACTCGWSACVGVRAWAEC